MSEEPRPASDSWKACPAGTLSQLSRRLRQGKRNQQLRRAAVGSFVMMLIVVGVWGTNQMIGTSRGADLTCGEVQRLLSDYVAGRLPARSVHNVERHLQHCPACTAKARQVRDAEKHSNRPASMRVARSGQVHSPSAS